MDTLKFNLQANGNKFKILNATNGGPIHKRGPVKPAISNFDDYKAARIPYSRISDSTNPSDSHMGTTNSVTPNSVTLS